MLMKWIFGFLGMYLGAILAEWAGAIAGFVIGFIGGAVLQVNSRLGLLEQELRTIKDNLLGSRVDIKKTDHLHQQITEPEIIPDTQTSERAHVVDNIPHVHDDKSDTPGPKTEKEYVVHDYTGKVYGFLRDFFTTGNVVVKTGVIILFFGVAFLISYAVERNAFPPGLRLLAIGSGGIIMGILGWRLRLKKPAYALILQGGGTGVLFLTVYAAGNIYTLITPLAGFLAMVILVLLSGWLAWLQNAHALAIFAATGGFLAPVLNSTGQGSHVILFSYYALLNAGIFGLAWFKTWRFLNWLGFVFTFVIASLWGYQYYQPVYFNTTEPFLVLFFLFYVGISILFSIRQPPDLRGLIDGSLVFGTPLIGFALQSELVGDSRYGQAWSALAIGMFYILITYVLRRTASLKLLTEAFLALGVIFCSLTVPFVLDGHWTATVWALEGAGIYWIGIRQQRLLPRMFGLLLQFCGALAFLSSTIDTDFETAILNSTFIGSVLIAVAGMFISYVLDRHKHKLENWEKPFNVLLLAWGLLWWFGAGINEIDKYLPDQYELNATVFFISVSALVISVLARQLNWHSASFTTILHLPVIALLMLFSFIGDSRDNPFYNLGYISWTIAIAVQYFLLWYHERVWSSRLLGHWHAATMWFLVFLATWTIARYASEIFIARVLWVNVAWGLVPAISIFVLLSLESKLKWPLKPYEQNYLYNGSVPICIYLVGWVIYACFQEGDPAPLRYIPIINPLDIAQLFAMLMLYEWQSKVRSGDIRNEYNCNIHTMLYLLAGLSFIWLNSLIAHTVHFYTDVRYDLYALFKSAVFQTSISITWTLVALGAMGFATWKTARKPWFAGASLLALAVLKLFVIDMKDSGTVAQIVSFITVGILMLMIGYFSPLPPGEKDTSTS